MQGVDPSEWGVGAMAGGLDEAVPVLEGKGTARLALVDMDWEHVKAVDILMVLRSFLAEVQSPPRSPLHGNLVVWPPPRHGSQAWPAQWLLRTSCRPDAWPEPPCLTLIAGFNLEVKGGMGADDERVATGTAR